MATLPVPREYLSGHTLRYKKMIKMLVVSCYPDHPIQFHTIICVCCQKTLTRSQYHEILFPEFHKRSVPEGVKKCFGSRKPSSFLPPFHLSWVSLLPFFLLSTSPGFQYRLPDGEPKTKKKKKKKKKFINASL